MGNNSSSTITKSIPLSKQESLKKIAIAKTLHFSTTEISVIQNSFRNIEMKMLEVGILTFQKLFETHPSAKTKFLSFKDMEITDLRGSDMFHNHVSRVMATVKRLIQKLDNPKEFDSYLKMLGEKHVMYKADPALIDSVAFIMFDCLHSVLEQEGNWNEEIEEAWGHLFYELAKSMKAPFDVSSKD